MVEEKKKLDLSELRKEIMDAAEKEAKRKERRCKK